MGQRDSVWDCMRSSVRGRTGWGAVAVAQGFWGLCEKGNGEAMGE